MQSMAQFMGEGHHVAELVRVVHQNVRVSAGYSAGAKSTASLAGPQFAINPTFREELADDAASTWAEGSITVLHDFLGRGPEARRHLTRQRCIAVVIVKLVQAKEFAFQP